MIEVLSSVSLQVNSSAAANWRQLSANVQGEVPIQVYFSLAAQLVIVNGATNTNTAAESESTSGRLMYYPAGIVYQLYCDPSKTWVRQNATSGSPSTAYVVKQS